MNKQIMPQMRILVTDFCDSKCIYCRPTGEGNLQCSTEHFLALEVAKEVAKIYQINGGTEIKISGGDPVYWDNLIEYVNYLKKELKFKKVEVITRSTKILTIIDELINVGLDVLNFSFDTTDKEKYTRITGKRDFERFVDTIEACTSKIYCKINMVIMQDINADDWRDMIAFCEKVGIRQLKLLDYIDDLSGKLNEVDSQSKYYLPFDNICMELRNLYGPEKIIYQGGLGHPMNCFSNPNGLDIICKNSKNGAWYCEECTCCPNYPCHDALMAVRVPPANSFQLCLLNENKHWYFNELTIEEKFLEILSIYQSAFFVGEL